MADPVVTYRGTIYPWHCDHMGHMNVMWYVGKFDEATWHLLASAGLTAKRTREEGIGMAAVEQRIEYKRAASRRLDHNSLLVSGGAREGPLVRARNDQ